MQCIFKLLILWRFDNEISLKLRLNLNFLSSFDLWQFILTKLLRYPRINNQLTMARKLRIPISIQCIMTLKGSRSWVLKNIQISIHWIYLITLFTPLLNIIIYAVGDIYITGFSHNILLKRDIIIFLRYRCIDISRHQDHWSVEARDCIKSNSNRKYF